MVTTAPGVLEQLVQKHVVGRCTVVFGPESVVVDVTNCLRSLYPLREVFGVQSAVSTAYIQA